MARRRTAKQRAASRRNIKKAQIASAKKRRGRGRKVAVVAVTGVALGTGALVSRHKVSGSTIAFGRTASGVKVSNLMSPGKNKHRVGKVATVGVRRRGVTYTHKSVTPLARNVAGRRVSGGPRDVMNRRPPNARERKRMDRFNVPMTDEAKTAAKMQASHSQGAVFGHKVKPIPSDAKTGIGRGSYSRVFGTSKGYGVPGRSTRTQSRGTSNPQAGRKISQAEVIRRTKAYMKDVQGTPTRRSVATSRITNPFTRHIANTVVGGTYGRRYSAAKQSQMARRASAYYSGQPLYTRSDPTVGRRGRKRSYELRRKKK